MMVVRLNFAALKQAKPYEYVVRFTLGGLTTVAAGGGHVLHLRACPSSVIDGTERELMLRECRLLASANPLARFQGWELPPERYSFLCQM
jgi:hypothetical protein